MKIFAILVLQVDYISAVHGPSIIRDTVDECADFLHEKRIVEVAANCIVSY